MMNHLEKIGQIRPKSAAEIGFSRVGIGFEKLDRDVFDPEKAYDKLAAIGAKYIRLQSGWMRTEKVKGVYDFAWLDSIVDNLIARGMKPWLCLCYGNPLYTEKANEVYGAVGVPPIFSEEEKAGWRRYVSAVAGHFHGRVSLYEIWNEPDGQWCWKHGPSGTEYGKFAVETGRAVKEADPEAKVLGGSVCLRWLHWLDAAMRQGMGDWIDYLTFHEYTPDETAVPGRVDSLRSVLDHYRPGIGIIQGESGSQSREGGHGALRECYWSEEKQAKQLARHTMIDLTTDVAFTSFFSCVDMIEALNGKPGDTASILDYGYFGVLGAQFDAEGHSTSTYEPKKSYYVLQNIASYFSDAKPARVPVYVRAEANPGIAGNECSAEQIIGRGLQWDDGRYAFVYWKPTNILTESYESTISLQALRWNRGYRLIDVMDGSIYKIPDEISAAWGKGGGYFSHLPIKDTPLALVCGDFDD